MMTTIRRSAWLLLLLAASSLLAQAPADQAQERVRCIVVLRQGELSDADAQRLGGTVEFRTARRLVLTLPRSAVDALRRNPNVKYIQESVLASESAAAAPLDAALAAEPQTPAPLAGSIPTWSSGDYQYDGAGNIYAIGTSAAPGSDGRISTYSYDVLGRLAGTTLVLPDRTASETYAYDVYGNLKAITPGGGQPFDVGVNSLNNKIAGEYDQAGNMVRWGTPRFVYDGANMVSSRTDEGGNVEYYVYTADDERIGVLRGQRWSWSVRGLDQKVLRRFESDEGLRTMDWLWVEDYVYRDGAVVATERMPEEGGRQHLHADHLGTTRLITGAGGALVSSHDYLPFGIELTSVNQHLAQGYALEEPSRFTGHERDFHGSATAQNENYLDYMHARFYNPKVGRFLSVDPVLDTEKALKEPQRWNRYSYVTNNPLRYVDPDGREMRFSDYASGVWEGIKETADDIGFAIAYPALKVMQGFINDDPKAIGQGTAMIAGEAVVGATLNVAANATFGWTSRTNWVSHARSHARNMGFALPEQYAAAGARFAATSGQKGVTTVAWKSGEKVIYNAATKEFAIVNKAGKIVDYRHANAKYWARQLKKWEDEKIIRSVEAK